MGDFLQIGPKNPLKMVVINPLGGGLLLLQHLLQPVIEGGLQIQPGPLDLQGDSPGLVYPLLPGDLAGELEVLLLLGLRLAKDYMVTSWDPDLFR